VFLISVEFLKKIILCYDGMEINKINPFQGFCFCE
jgi:hypothetical protein